jgi:hypothetical protein
VAQSKIDPILTLMPSLIAKSSFLWFPILYIISNKQIRFKISKRIYNLSQYSKQNHNQNNNQNVSSRQNNPLNLIISISLNDSRKNQTNSNNNINQSL